MGTPSTLLTDVVASGAPRASRPLAERIPWREIRWPVAFTIPALLASHIVLVPMIAQRLLISVKPWVTNSEDKLTSLYHEMPRLLTSAFWPSALLWALFMIGYTAADPVGKQVRPPTVLGLLGYYTPFFFLLRRSGLFNLCDRAFAIRATNDRPPAFQARADS